MTKISWTHMPGFKGETWDIVEGCTKVSSGCAHCWAIRQVNRISGNPALREMYGGLVKRQDDGLLNWTGQVREMHDRLPQPEHWCAPRMVFVASRGDLFHERVSEAFIAEVFERMANTPRHLYLVLTKRPVRAVFLRDALVWAPNIWFGVSVESQRYANLRIPPLLKLPAARRFVSYEPALGPIEWRPEWASGLDWIIYGGETEPGGKFRPDQSAWAWETRQFCANYRIAFYFKQQAGRRPDVYPWPDDNVWRQWPGMLTPLGRLGRGEKSE